MHFRLSSQPKWRHKYDRDPATICSAVHYRLQNISPRLASSLSVNTIISTIRRRKVVHRLYLGASALGDTGCVRLFEFLTSRAGSQFRESITEIFLTKNEIGSQGLLAVAAFLKDNTVLRELCLSGNPLTTDPDVITEFTSALNSSRLCTLQILHSNSLGDRFVRAFLPKLTTPYLRELDLSAINMTRDVVPILAGYVNSGWCRLERLQCNANSLTLSGARNVINAIEGNYCLRNVKLDDLHLDENDTEDRTIGWQECTRALSVFLHRNSELRERVRDESLALLRYSRALFLRSGAFAGASNESTPNFAALSRRSRSSQSFVAPSPFFDLPPELQQEIISYLAPSLSHRQRMRVVFFAADITTLFTSGQSHTGRGRTRQQVTPVKSGLGKRSSSQQGHPFEGTWRPPTWWECSCAVDLLSACRCRRLWKREMRDIWLTQVACDAYEPDP